MLNEFYLKFSTLILTENYNHTFW